VILNGKEYDVDDILQKVEHEWPWIGKAPGELIRALLAELEKRPNTSTDQHTEG
jgi:hypothetical protein